jgi:DNA-binding response OmpR family regulator
MPEVSGDFLIKLIRTFQHLRSVPIVAVTSDANEESNTSILRKGADAIIHKPVDAETLVDRVTETLLRTMENPTPNPKTENCDNLIEQKKAAVKSAEAELWNILREQDRTEQKKTDTKSAESELWNVLREQDRTEQKKADVKSVESELWKMMR